MRYFIIPLLATVILGVLSVTVFAVLPDDMVLYYNFNTDSGNIVKDFSKYGNNGEIDGTIKWTKGQHNGSLELDGRNTVLTAQPSKSLASLKAPMTVGAILQILDFPGKWQSLVVMNGSADKPDSGWAAQFCNLNPTFTTLGTKDHIAEKIILEKGKWYYLVYVYDGKNASFYVDSVLSDQIAGAGEINCSKSPMLTMGADQGIIGTYPASVILDEFWISNIAKNEQEIKDLASPIDSLFSVENTDDSLSTTWGKIKATLR